MLEFAYLNDPDTAERLAVDGEGPRRDGVTATVSLGRDGPYNVGSALGRIADVGASVLSVASCTRGRST